MTQTTFRDGGKGESIGFTVSKCSLGLILVAVTKQGVGAISLGDDPAALVRELRGRFPMAEPIGEDRDFERLMTKVAGFVEAPWLGVDLPLDVRGTPFQQRVWQALREIPAGSTVSYGEIAERIGAPKKAYDVGQACASNMIAVAIPCHRAVRKNGALAGYRWGVARKRALLEREARA
jgi:AraC family transcriptional regulator of adaptative response/methylated-DNA-[protein]-cysteine methyltransferase